MAIDWWTLGFQAVNVVVLVWLLQHFFWRPVAAMIELRRTTMAKALADAKAAQHEAACAMAGIATTREGFAKERDDILAKAREQATAASKATQDAAAKDAEARAKAAKDAAAAAHDAEQEAWTEHAAALAVQIAGRLAGRLQGPAIRTAFLDWLVASIQAMPAPARQEAVAEGGGFDAVSAETLSPADQDHASSLIAKAFGAKPQIAFRTDPALIAGIELHGPHFVLGNSWRADLGHILQEIRHAPGR